MLALYDRCQTPSCALFNDEAGATFGSLFDAPSSVVDVWSEGDSVYAAMCNAIRSATHCVRLETFIFADDAVGRRFADALVERAQAGVLVQVQVDALRAAVDRNGRLLGALKAAGVLVKKYGPFRAALPRSFLRRDHRKLLIIDERRAFLGGFNIHAQSSQTEVGTRRWRDTHVELRGELASVATHAFDNMWSGNPASRLPTCARMIDGEMLVADASFICQHRLRCLFDAAFTQARRRIYLTTPYFVPHPTLENSLTNAARRGVDVRVLVPHRSNHPLALAAGKTRYQSLLASGVRIFEYLPRLLHAKTAVVDDHWATVGTANLDYLSLFANYEINLVSNRTALAERLSSDFSTDLGNAIEVDAAGWNARPIISRMGHQAAWRVRRWL